METVGRKEFAVLIPLLAHEGQECVLLTKRPETLPEYSGHVSFPGGARDPGDADLQATAIREAGEEVGIARERIAILSEMPWHSTALGHQVKPFLARVAPGPITPNPQEVERVLYLPVDLVRQDPFQVRTWKDAQGIERSTWSFLYEGCDIWGLTARILRLCFVDPRGT